MKTLILATMNARNFTALILSVGVLFVLGFACGGSGTPPPSEYVGAWTGNDGSTITIRADGSGDYKSGGTTVTNGSVEIDDAKKELTIKLVGIGPTLKIDKEPSGNKMTLGGVVYTKGGGSSDTKSDTKSDSKSDAKPEIPSKDKLQTLVKTSFMDFSDAVQAEDFTDFNKKVAKVWQEQTSPDEMKDAFKVFVDNKADYNFKRAIASLDATFSPEPTIGKVLDLDALILKGYYPTSPARANFELKYVMEDGNWKLVGINIKTEIKK